VSFAVGRSIISINDDLSSVNMYISNFSVDSIKSIYHFNAREKPLKDISTSALTL